MLPRRLRWSRSRCRPVEGVRDIQERNEEGETDHVEEDGISGERRRGRMHGSRYGYAGKSKSFDMKEREVVGHPEQDADGFYSIEGALWRGLVEN